MSRKPYILALIALAGLGIASCNSEAEVTTVSTYESTVVDAFSLTKNEKVLRNLDSVYFSIDLTNARIYNADSLPKGTDVSRLVPKISTSSVSRVELIVNRSILGDTIYNYLESQKDSIDFTRPVTLRITAQNGNVRDYQVKVNVHQSEPDSLSWSRAARTALPTLLEEPTDQKTIEFKGNAVTLTTDDAGNACVATAENPAKGWEMKRIALPADAVTRSFTSTTEGLYILDSAGMLYRSAEPGADWTATGASFSWIFGGYNDIVLGVRHDSNGQWTLASYPESATTPQAAPEGFPVSATSQLIVYSSEWSQTPTAVMAGGFTADGTATGSTWAFDGSHWACINPSGLPATADVTLVPYFAFKTSANWTVTRETVLIALGGRLDNSPASRNVYISWDRGISWKKAASAMTLPSYMSAFAAADALVFDSTISAARSAATTWTELPDSPLPVWERIATSRAVTAPTEWECPYIYLFGGVNSTGELQPDVWRGVINRLEYMPLY